MINKVLDRILHEIEQLSRRVSDANRTPVGTILGVVTIVLAIAGSCWAYFNGEIKDLESRVNMLQEQSLEDAYQRGKTDAILTELEEDVDSVDSWVETHQRESGIQNAKQEEALRWLEKGSSNE